MSSPANTERISQRPLDERLEGFPLLHLDCYGADPDALGWPAWIAQFGHRRIAPGRGIRYRKVVHALEAVFSDAGLMICGLGLVQSVMSAGKLSVPFELREGGWSSHAYRLSFRGNAPRRHAATAFRDWLVAEAAASERQLHALVEQRQPAPDPATPVGSSAP